MKTTARIDLYAPGIVIFDPSVLDRFLRDHAIDDGDVFSRFLEDEALGHGAIEQGVICPVYQIPEAEYSVFLIDDGAAAGIDGEPEFSYAGLPLKITSGILVVADLNALTDWDREFFTAYKSNYARKLPNNDYLDVPNGLYSVTLSGHVGLDAPYADVGYGLALLAVSDLPELDPDASVDDRCYALTGTG